MSDPILLTEEGQVDWEAERERVNAIYQQSMRDSGAKGWHGMSPDSLDRSVVDHVLNELIRRVEALEPDPALDPEETMG